MPLQARGRGIMRDSFAFHSLPYILPLPVRLFTRGRGSTMISLPLLITL